MKRFAFLADIGSTFTKGAVIELCGPEIICTGEVPTTSEPDAGAGFTELRKKLTSSAGVRSFDLSLASSSAAGGLKVVAIGLMSELTAKAAKLACLNAGAKLARVYCNRLNREDVSEIENLAPDIILLAGGTDGGNAACVLHNAEQLSRLCPGPVLLYAGNRAAADGVRSICRGMELHFADNVLPELNLLNIEPAREKIREIFLARIVRARGLERISRYLSGPLEPTPLAVLDAVMLLARGSRGEERELMAIDVGGATTDVFSASSYRPARTGTVLKGIPEPYARRTVEGDIGLRHSVEGLLMTEDGRELLNENRLMGEWVGKIRKQPDIVPSKTAELECDSLLAGHAAHVAVGRHCGRLTGHYSPMGRFFVQEGKDLSEVTAVVATGGVFVHNPYSVTALRKAFCGFPPGVLSPRRPEITVDSGYVMYAAGLLSGYERQAAAAIMEKECLKEWNLQTGS